MVSRYHFFVVKSIKEPDVVVMVGTLNSETDADTIANVHVMLLLQYLTLLDTTTMIVTLDIIVILSDKLDKSGNVDCVASDASYNSSSVGTASIDIVIIELIDKSYSFAGVGTDFFNVGDRQLPDASYNSAGVVANFVDGTNFYVVIDIPLPDFATVNIPLSGELGKLS